MDFYQIRQAVTKTGTHIYPDFIVQPSQDLMVRGGSFYAVWDEDAGLWSTNELSVQRLVDADLYAHAERLESPVEVRVLSSYRSKLWQEFRSYIGNMPNSHHPLDGILAFANTSPKKGDYCSKRLPYSLEAGLTDSYDKMMSTLYDPAEREKLEWAVGAVLAGDSVKIQKFFVLYGEGGTGKGTFLDILKNLFPGYTTVFDAKALTGNHNAFATEAFKNNPLVAIQHDGDLSRIDDNTLLNSIVSHEEIIVNQKFKPPYPATINSFLFIGTNQSVKITDAKSGLIRRLIDVHPTGNLLPPNEYEAAKLGITFELGAIAHRCLELYRSKGPNYFSRYRPTDMIIRTDVFYNYMITNFDLFKENDCTTLKQAWALYKNFCDDGGYDWRLNLGKFRDELRNYFHKFEDRGRVDGVQCWNVYRGFKTEKLGPPEPPSPPALALVLENEASILDDILSEQPAQYAEDGTPAWKWKNVRTKLADLNTSRTHYVKLPPGHIVIDFDLKGTDGEKSLALNMQAASNWPPTYAELSKGGAGIHLHYIYGGDVSELSHSFAQGIEVKTFPDDASLRRRLSRCNDVPIGMISSGLPLKEKRMLDSDVMRSEKALRDLIMRNLRKEIHPGTKPSVDFIWKILEDAWNSGMQYDITDLRNRILAFANNSSNHSSYCVKTVTAMKFASESSNVCECENPADDRIVIYDVEVFPNLFVVCWKFKGNGNVIKLINPAPSLIEDMFKLLLIGFNNRRFDNHMLYARAMGYSEMDLYNLSQKIISGEKNAMFGDAYNLSHADVYDFSTKKQSLKRFQIELGLNHKELGLPWGEPVDLSLWEEVAEYCANDVVTTEQVFDARKQDYVARQILAALSGLLVNDTTQRHTAQIIFGKDRKPQDKFKYTDLSKEFPGYEYSFGKSSYRGEDPGEGGYVYAEPGMYTNVAVLDIASMHPTTITLLDLFGPYTKTYAALKDARVAIKHKDYDGARKMLNGALVPYLDSPEDAEALSYSLKIALNIVYGLTSASFDNPFRDVRNKDNIVAKRGALFMIDLKNAVQEKGFQVIHIKTDSIKIPDATPEIIEFVINFGQKYGYDFEHEVTYDRLCLVNDAVYIARDSDSSWHATGAQFQHPYVFKTLFSGEDLVFEDYCETKTVTTAMYLQYGNDEPVFVGRAGSFVPVCEDTGGGKLLRISNTGTFNSVGGAKNWFWREAIVVKELDLQDTIDMRYFRELTEGAMASLTNYGDADWFRGKE